MNRRKRTFSETLARHKHQILAAVVILASGGMLLKGAMQRPQLKSYNTEIEELETKIAEERERQAEIDDLKTKVNSDEYIEKIASDKLGLVKSNAKIFLDVSDDN
jgi:cell division protein DivIC